MQENYMAPGLWRVAYTAKTPGCMDRECPVSSLTISGVDIVSEPKAKQWIGKLMHHVEITGYKFTDTVLFDICPMAVSLHACDISAIDVTFWKHYVPAKAVSTICSIKLNSVIVSAKRLGVVAFYGYLIYKLGPEDSRLIAASRHINLVPCDLDSVITTADSVYLDSVHSPGPELHPFRCKHLYLYHTNVPIVSDTIETLHIHRGYNTIGPLPELRSLYLCGISMHVVSFPKLQRLYASLSPRRMYIANNSSLQTIEIDTCDNVVQIDHHPSLESIKARNSNQVVACSPIQPMFQSPRLITYLSLVYFHKCLSCGITSQTCGIDFAKHFA
jgi:hypothetical protein